MIKKQKLRLRMQQIWIDSVSKPVSAVCHCYHIFQSAKSSLNKENQWPCSKKSYFLLNDRMEHLFFIFILYFLIQTLFRLQSFPSLMNNQSSQTPQDQLEEGQINAEWAVHDLQNQQNSYDSPSVMQLQKPSRRSIRIKSVSSSKSRCQLIRVSKLKDNGQSGQNKKQAQWESITGVSKRQCRICLQDEAEGRLLKPCKCTGSMQYAHEHCLGEWIKRKINFRQKGKVNCEVCEEPFDYKICKRLSLSYQKLKENYQRFRSNYICFLIVMGLVLMIWLTLLIVTCMGLSGQENWVKRNIMRGQETRMIFLSVVFVYLIVMVFASLLFLAEYAIKTDYFIKNLQNYNKKFKKIAPKLYSIAT